MNHPPIPPNCPYFRQDADGKWWFCYRGAVDGRIGIDADFREHDWLFCWRHFIACVARCAWLDEARSRKKRGLADRVVNEAWELGEAWRKWAEVKEDK